MRKMRTPENLQELSYTLESPKTFEDLIGSKREYPTAEVVENFLWAHLGGIFETQELAFSSCCPDNFVHCLSVVPLNTHLQLSVD